ncbi:MAG: TIGR03643 family protein [Rhodobacteraceae bacterium]|nr:TIGR03643 family protein [Paracoccaceae bacterium]
MSRVEKYLSQAQLSELIEVALSDKVRFAAIRDEFGLREIEVKNMMRKNLRPKSYEAWRKRIFRKAK